MILLTKTEEILLLQYHERKGDRVGAHTGDTLTLDDFRHAEQEAQGLEFEGALDNLVAHGVVEKEGDSFVLSQPGYDYLYTREGRRIDEV
jgi:hypothetical protein